jgi:hypothetical protein
MEDIRTRKVPRGEGVVAYNHGSNDETTVYVSPGGMCKLHCDGAPFAHTTQMLSYIARLAEAAENANRKKRRSQNAGLVVRS